MRTLLILILVVGCRREEVRASADPTPSVSTPTSAPVNAVSIEIPRELEGATSLSLAIDAAGAVMVDGKLSTDAEIERLTRAAITKNPGLRAVISADAKVSYGRVIAITDLVKRAGVTKIAFAVAR